jgi:hypothetical protein
VLSKLGKVVAAEAWNAAETCILSFSNKIFADFSKK